jgi:hypothetical protein
VHSIIGHKPEPYGAWDSDGTFASQSPGSVSLILVPSVHSGPLGPVQSSTFGQPV